MPGDATLWTAAHCRHYAMCKIDYLGTGVCPAGVARPYVAYFPQGRMDIVDALARGRIPVTEGLLDVADSCDLCGVCELQCHFYSSLRPLPVMAALKSAAAEHRRSGAATARAPSDPLVEELRAIVGRDWAANDPAITVAYSHDPYPLGPHHVPRAVVLPGSAEEVEAVMRLVAREQVPFVVRGNGGSIYGKVFSEGLVLDTARMKELEFDPANWTVTVGPGVTAFELQREALRRGFRVNVGEPTATVVGNVVCTGLFSPWTAAYGMGADHVLDMEFVDHAGRRFRLADPDGAGPAHLAYRHRVAEVPGVCTRAQIRLQPVTGDEAGLIVPFDGLEPALRYARDLARRRIGLALAVLGPHFIATFLAPTWALAQAARRAFPEDLGFGFGVLVVADRFGLDAARALAGKPVIDQDLFRTLALGLPRVIEPKTLDLLRDLEGDRPAVEALADPEVRPVVQAALGATPATIAAAVEPDLRAAYERLYARPELTDLLWLNQFRILSARLARHKHFMPLILFVPLEGQLITALARRLGEIAEEAGLEHAYGFVTPIDMGKRAVLEYDWYVDQADPADKERTARAMDAVVPWLDGLCAQPGSNLTWLKTVFTQGTARKESWLYRDLSDRADAG
ncbi:FAD-binding oxidoreductase [Anaeromyxobacter oryzisoli]|uniref:FAD-binding oxidoreductase n=1 Tax=Anaeromyxobacter oryzisoli TaxID=2925408 RepID=UPI001F56194E|nr:FAD-binding oxidoreductase [Anaeromyxobacter sp. SG63]